MLYFVTYFPPNYVFKTSSREKERVREREWKILIARVLIEKDAKKVKRFDRGMDSNISSSLRRAMAS